jgi:D-alanyl-D-alanine carboxypeptidase
MLNRYLATGTGRSPVGSPGERFHYSDTAYVLLGVLLERATGRRYHELQRDQIVEPLGLADTYLAYHDDPAPDARSTEADVWYGDIPVLSTGLDLSLDWAGGGQVSTAADLSRFLQALLGGELHRTPTSAAAVRDWRTPPGLTPPRVGIGLGLLHVTAGRRSVIGHSGAWGVRVFHDPASGAYLTGTVGQPDSGAWMADVFDAVDDELVE